MPQATFTPRWINPPKQGARSASIKDTDGGYWGIHPGDMGKYTVGVPVTVEYRQNGKYFNVDSIVGQQAPANPQTQTYQQRHTPPVDGRGQQPSRPQPNPQADPRKSEDIFVCGVVNHAIAHQSLPIGGNSMAQLVQAARWAWRHGEPTDVGGGGAMDEPPFPGSPDDYGNVDPRG